MQDLITRAAKARQRLATSAVSDPESVWIGHVSTGGYGPHKIGRGPRLISGGVPGGGPASKPASSFDGTWNFDVFQVGELDSLQGWWPQAMPFQSVGPTDKDDNERPWFGLDYGNVINYAPLGAAGRTFGVTGLWHADNGTSLTSTVAGSNPVAPGWAPIAGAKSMWCGLRSHGDLTATDGTPGPTLGNPYNSSIAGTTWLGDGSGRQTGSLKQAGAWTDANFPGYSAQTDQMLYRDFVLAANLSGGQSFDVSFNYTTNMSTLFSGAHSSQTGWFHFDPLKPSVANDGNFISATSGTGPADSFMVYVGAPVEVVPGDAPVFADFIASDGVGYDIYDQQRRWFSEVIKKGNTVQLLRAGGVNGTTGAPVVFATSLSAATINDLLDADGGVGNGGKVRLVFRVKTNRGSDDENSGNSGFSSGGAGAAIVDEVAVTAPAIAFTEGFEGANGGVDNSVGTAASAAWKSTGKPPGRFPHVHNLADGLPFTDPCGAINSTVRLCNMGGNVLSPGNHDLADKPGGVFGSNTQDQQKIMVSPTVNLVASGEGVYNGMGIDSEIASRGNIVFFADQLWNVYDYNISTGNGWRIGWQSYPATQANGVKTWGVMHKSIFFSATGGILGCFDTFESEAYGEQLIKTTNASGQPDSVRVYIEAMSRCFALPLTAAQCSPTSGASAGGYFDNLSIGLVTAPPPPSVGVEFATNYNDCFPVNSQNKAVTAFGTAYDTLAAHIRTGYNIAPNRKNDLTGPSARTNVPGDTTLVLAPATEQVPNVRVDMVFRILPGVGNYVTIGNRATGVARRPDVTPRVAAAAGDVANGNVAERFWGAYLANNGTYGTPGGHAGGVWDPNVWNSARIDTVEKNFFPVRHLYQDESTIDLTSGQYMSAYHEDDPKYTVLGIAKNRCFLNKTKISGGGGGGNYPKLDQGQINCGLTAQFPQFTGFPPAAYVVAEEGRGHSGLVASENGLAIGKTYEGTKIVPDGQLTPGAHIQYFFRKSPVGDAVAFEMTPDTNFVIPNDFFGSFDGHRWYNTSVLPDRWKDPAFAAGGTGMACMLVLDVGDRRGDEFVWVSMADSIGLTSAGKRGSHNGWRARPDQSVLGNIGGDDAIARRDNGGQAGTLWDLYQTIAGESNIQSGRPGSRASAVDVTAGSLTLAKKSTHGPTEDMLKNYQTVIYLASDNGIGVLGPIANQTDNDLGLLTSYLAGVGGAAQPRGLIMHGYDLGDALGNEPTNAAFNTFLTVQMRASLRNSNYRTTSGNVDDVTTLTAKPPVSPSSFVYGIGNQCTIDNDMFFAEVAAPAGQSGADYAALGGGGGGAPYVASVYAPAAGARPYRTLINGWTLGLFGGGFGTQTNLLNVGVRKYWYDALVNAFGGVSCQPSGTPVGIGDGPGAEGSAFVNFMSLKSSNPMRSGEARMAFGITRTERVEVKVYDVTGRLVKTVANRTFLGGQEHVVTWDGSDEVGNRVKSGVYFYQLKTPNWTSQKKLAVLTD